MLHSISAYIKFLLHSTNKHGIHSPFVYDFTTRCLNKPEAKFKIWFEEFKQPLVTNHDIIEVIDFGAGSKHFKNNKRTISKILNNAGISNKRGRLLYKMIQYFKPERILEVGTSLGLATACLSIGNPKAQVVTLEGCPETAKLARNQFTNFKLQNIEIIIGNFNKTLQNILISNQFDFIYFDGNHQKEATIQYFELALLNVKNNSIFVFDDIHWNQEMEQAWDYIKDHPKVTISIDTFQWGIVFFRNEQIKEHFIIRI